MARKRTAELEKSDDPFRPVCGLVMPISAIDGCSEGHWDEVRQILTDSIKTAGFESNLVSAADDVGIIQKRIIQNLYDNPVVVCDVSGKNPNVMFELGIRLAFDKPTVIVKDDMTTYSFDTAPIEHLSYPRDLRFSAIVKFRGELSKKIKATYDKSQSDEGYTTFLKHFGAFSVAKLETREVTPIHLLIEEVKSLADVVRRIPSSQFIDQSKRLDPPSDNSLIPSMADEIEKYLAAHPLAPNEELNDRRGELFSMLGSYLRSRRLGFVNFGEFVESAIRLAQARQDFDDRD